MMYRIVRRLLPIPSKNELRNRVIHPSNRMLMRARAIPIAGVIQKRAAGGVSIPIDFLPLSLVRRIWVNDHRRPPDALAASTRRNPTREKDVSVATIRTTPIKISDMTPISRHENTSSLKRKAKIKTKTNDEFLTMAEIILLLKCMGRKWGLKTHCKRTRWWSAGMCYPGRYRSLWRTLLGSRVGYDRIQKRHRMVGCIWDSDLPILLWRWLLWRTELLGPSSSNTRCQCELDPHVTACNKQWEWKSIMVRWKHPLVV